MKVKDVCETRLHLWYLVTDDLHQHLGKLHLQSLRLAESVEAKVQQVPHQLQSCKESVIRFSNELANNANNNAITITESS